MPGGTRRTQILAARPVHVLVAAALADGALVLAAVAEVEQRREPFVDHQDDAAAVAAVAAGGPALGDELLATQGDGSVAAVPAAHPDAGFVDERGHGAPVGSTGQPHARAEAKRIGIRRPRRRELARC